MRALALAAIACFAAPAFAQWDPATAKWGKTDPRDFRVMTYNVQDGICSTIPKVEGFNSWCALARSIAAMKPDVLIMQETGDNDGNGTGSGVDSVANLTTVLNLLFDGGTDPFLGGSVTSWVKKYAPSYDLNFIYVANTNDGFNRNVLLSKYPFTDLNGDTRTGLDTWVQLATSYAPGGTPGIRGFIWCEIDLPASDYAGNVVVGTCHLRSGGAASDLSERLNAGKNIAYYIDAIFNGLGTAAPDPGNFVLDSPAATSILSSTTPAIWGGDFNEDENTNGRDGPALWMTRAASASPGGTDGTDRDRTDSTFDSSVEFFTGNRSTQSSSKLDYLCWQDSIATLRRSFVFNSGSVPGAGQPAELLGFVPSAANVTSTASDHRPVIADFILPAPPTPPGAFALLSPDDASVHVSLTPTLDWANSTGATTYTLTISTSPTLTPALLTVPGLATSSYTVGSGVLSNCQTYYWGVSAINGAGATASTPSAFSFESIRPSDFNADGFVDAIDYDEFIAAWLASDLAADVNQDEFVDAIDYDQFIGGWLVGC